MAYPKFNGNGDPQLLTYKTKDDEIEQPKFKTEKHDYENFLNSLKIDNDYFKKV